SSGATDIVGNLENTNINGANNPFNIDTEPPAGYSVSIDQTYINNTNTTSASFTFASADIGTTYNYSIDDTSGAFTSPITDTGTITSTTDQITSIDVSSLNDEDLILTVSLTDTVGNQGSDATSTVVKDATPPTTPTALPVAGTYTSTQSVVISGSDIIHYTTSGIATCSSPTYAGAVSVISSQTISAIGCDTAGNESSVASFVYTITLPTVSGGGASLAPATPPIVLSPSLVAGGAWSNSQTITLNFFVNNATQVAFSEDSTFANTSWLAYSPSKQFILSNGFGGKIVYVKFRSKDGGVTETYKINVNFTEKSVLFPSTGIAVAIFETTNPDSKLIIVPVKKLQFSPNSLIKYTYQYKNESKKTIKIKVVRQVVDTNGKVVNKRIGSTSIKKNKTFKFNASNTIGNKLTDGIYTVQIKIMDAKTGKIFEENGFNITVKRPIVIKKVGNNFKK
ncbi:MAG: chitobiase/beta-hexosaminidase C-terminal domain-containing protein, partial [bacterium]|nr:chitobiase/beta-hexosaminidase C-terminal domain-containing protein [bacterium]